MSFLAKKRRLRHERAQQKKLLKNKSAFLAKKKRLRHERAQQKKLVKKKKSKVTVENLRPKIFQKKTHLFHH